MARTYEEGLKDGIQMQGEVCTSMGDCDACPISIVKGEGVTCSEFCKQFPSKALSIFKQMANKDHSYFDEFYTRFPESTLSREEVANEFCCRTLFGVDSEECPKKGDSVDCEKCWNMKFGSTES